MARWRKQVLAVLAMRSRSNIQWDVRLECGHRIWIKAKRKPPVRAMRRCLECPDEDPVPRNPRVVFSIVESTTRRGRMSFRLNPHDATAHGLFDVIERSGFRPGDRVLMVLAPEPSAGKTIDELIAASSLGTPGAVALRMRSFRPSQMERDLEEMEAEALREDKAPDAT